MNTEKLNTDWIKLSIEASLPLDLRPLLNKKWKQLDDYLIVKFDQIRQETAKEIFEEIEKECDRYPKDKEEIMFIDLDLDTLEKNHLAHATEDGMCKKYWIRINETNIEDLLQSIYERIKAQQKTKQVSSSKEEGA